MKELMIFGDSILKGVVFDQEQNRYHLCREADFSPLEQQGVTVENRSKMGATIREGLKLLDRLSPVPGPSVALLEYGGNDCNYDWKSVSEEPEREHRPFVTIDEFAACYRRAIAKAKQLAHTVAVCTLTPLDSNKFMNFISRGNSYERILRWLGDVGILYRWQEHYNHVAMEVARQEGCFVVDTRTDFMIRHDFEQLLCADGIHPTPQGHRLLRQSVCRKLTPLFA